MDRRSKGAGRRGAPGGPAGGGSGSAPSPARQARRALVLNATFEPLGIVSSRRAVLLVLDTKAELVHTTERFFRAERFSLPEPSVVRPFNFVLLGPTLRAILVDRLL